MALALALIGYGEVGQLFAREFVASDAAVAVYDIKCDDPFGREPLAMTAAKDNVQLAGSPRRRDRGRRHRHLRGHRRSGRRGGARRGGVAAAGADLCRPQLGLAAHQTRGRRRRSAAREFVEFAVMSPVAGLGIASPILAGGAERRGARRAAQPARHEDRGRQFGDRRRLGDETLPLDRHQGAGGDHGRSRARAGRSSASSRAC